MRSVLVAMTALVAMHEFIVVSILVAVALLVPVGVLGCSCDQVGVFVAVGAFGEMRRVWVKETRLT